MLGEGIRRSVISRLLVQDILPVNSPYARIRLRDSLVIACRGFIRGFKPKPTHLLVALSLLVARTESVLSPSLEAQLSLPLHQFNPPNLVKDHFAC